MIVSVVDQQSALKISTAQIQKLVQEVIHFEGQDCDEVSIHLVETAAICELHEQYFDDPSPTDCISFPMDGDESLDYRVLGDAFICPATAVQYAQEHQKNPYEETTLYIVHCLLHLMGYDDIDPADEKKMREAEARHMKSLMNKKLLLG